MYTSREWQEGDLTPEQLGEAMVLVPAGQGPHITADEMFPLDEEATFNDIGPGGYAQGNEGPSTTPDEPLKDDENEVPSLLASYSGRKDNFGVRSLADLVSADPEVVGYPSSETRALLDKYVYVEKEPTPDDEKDPQEDQRQ